MICLYCRGEKAKGQIILVLMVVQFCGRITAFPCYVKRSQPSCILIILCITIQNWKCCTLDSGMSKIDKPGKARTEICVLVVTASLAGIPIAQGTSYVRQMRCIKQFCNKRHITFYTPKNKLAMDGVLQGKIVPYACALYWIPGQKMRRSEGFLHLSKGKVGVWREG